MTFIYDNNLVKVDMTWVGGGGGMRTSVGLYWFFKGIDHVVVKQ